MDNGAAWTGGAFNLNTDYNSAQLIVNALGQGLEFRVVGAGLRVRYIGPLLQEAGIAHCFIDPDHYSIQSQTVSQIGMMETYFNMPITQTDWITLTYSPVCTQEFMYQPDPINNPGFNFGRATDQHFMGIAFSGLPPGNNLSVEVVIHYEAVGRVVRGKTATPSDVVGTGIVLGATSSGTQLENQDPNVSVKDFI